MNLSQGKYDEAADSEEAFSGFKLKFYSKA